MPLEVAAPVVGPGKFSVAKAEAELGRMEETKRSAKVCVGCDRERVDVGMSNGSGATASMIASILILMGRERR